MADNRIAYGLAKRYRIDTKGMTPKEVWDALNEKGVTRENAAEKYTSDGMGGEHEETPAEKKRLKELGVGIDSSVKRKKPRKQLERAEIDTSGKKFQNSFQELMYKSNEFKKINAKQTMEDTGVNEEEARDMNASIAVFTGNGYMKIRDLKNKEYDKSRELIEKYIENAPPFDGDIYRGIALNDGGAFAKKLFPGNELDMEGISSWTDVKSIAEKFANKRDDASYGVVFKCKNKNGVGVKHLSNIPSESEVLQSQKTKFIITKVDIVKNPKGLKIYQVDLEEA